MEWIPIRYHLESCWLQIESDREQKTMKKQHLPQKICVVCHRPFHWRKKWEKAWDEVKYCSKKCSQHKKRKETVSITSSEKER